METLNWISLAGIFVMVALAWTVSSHRTRVNWRLVGIGILLQAALAAVLFESQNWTFTENYRGFSELQQAVDSGSVSVEAVDQHLSADNLAKYETLSSEIQAGTRTLAEVNSSLGEISIPKYPDGILFAGVNAFFAAINEYVKEGSAFVFRANAVPEDNPTDPMVLLGTFAFGVLPTVIFFASLMSILYYLGLMQLLIRGMAWVMQKTLGTSGPESMAAAANVLVGHTEAPLVIRPYVEKMTRSELNALMVGGFATISGSLMAIFVFYGISAGHLLTASIISAPAALGDCESPSTRDRNARKRSPAVSMAPEQVATNVIEAAAIGASDGVKLAINITGMLIAFLALLALLNAMVMGLGELTQYFINLGTLRRRCRSSAGL